ncbi:hypothetical protein [Hyalangium versicolor]|uniref:hypothetical protein n=1 Tax=Hyalangium versicolor TaxID=2861190 RepID=UPI001CCDB4C5|nr:hypothetical protein [Hyalangium versicolor]
MENNNRIASLSITPTLARQTPRNEFGAVLARTAQEVVKTGASIVGGMVPSGPVMSAAVSSVSSTVASVGSTNASITPIPGTGSTGSVTGTTGTTGQGDAWDMLEAQRLMAEDGQKFNMAYLGLQNEMQKESREHNAISNIMKVRHDSAKAAINNIR